MPCACGSHRVGWRSFQVAARWSLQVETAADRCAELSLSSITVPGWHSDVRSLTVLGTLCFGCSRAGAAETHASRECAVALVVNVAFKHHCAVLARDARRFSRIGYVDPPEMRGFQPYILVLRWGWEEGRSECVNLLIPAFDHTANRCMELLSFSEMFIGFSRVGYLVFFGCYRRFHSMVSNGCAQWG